jgi:transcriptional regulator GlxA family with amidase domain
MIIQPAKPRRPLTAPPPAGEARQIVIVAFSDVQLLDVSGPADVFSLADAFSVGKAFDVTVVSSRGGPVRSTSGIQLMTSAVTSVAPSFADTLIVAGGSFEGLVEAIGDKALADWVRQAADQARRYASVCSGAFALAEWGLLAGRRATTHWSAADRLGRRYPDISVAADSIFVQDGRAWTSGGVTSGIDMCLAMVEADLGRLVAARVAKQLILPMRRLGNQSQFSLLLETQAGRYASLVDWIRTHIAQRIGNEKLAELAGESERTFHRHFLAETGKTPADFVETMRLEVAREHLEEGASVKMAARVSGFTSAEHLAKVFGRRHGLAPAQYRALHASGVRTGDPHQTILAGITSGLG